jgi:hypothetical protein
VKSYRFVPGPRCRFLGAASMRGRRLVSFALKTAWARSAVVGKVGEEAERTKDSASALMEIVSSGTCHRNEES